MTSKVFMRTFLLIIVGWMSISFNAYAFNFEYQWVNPQYRHIYKGITIKHDRREAEPTALLCDSYVTVKETLQTQLQNRVTDFNLHLVFSFVFEDVSTIVKQALDEIKSEDHYLRDNMSGYKLNYNGYDGDVTVSIQVAYLTTYEQELYVNEQVNLILSEIINPSMTSYEKIKAIHDWIVLHVQYDEDLNEYSAWAALQLGETVCQGYSLLFYRMTTAIGFQCMIVIGDQSMDHAWNLILMDDLWYHVDVTWDDPVPDTPGKVIYSNFLKSDSDMIQCDHIWDRSKYPAALQSYMQSNPLDWYTDKEAAVSAALSQNKRLIMVAGRDTCGNTNYMRETVFETSSPPIKATILNHFIVWFCHVDQSNDWHPYSGGLGSFSLPLIAFIEPQIPNGYLKRTTGSILPDEFITYIDLIMAIPEYEPLTWFTSKSDAMNAAVNQNKMVLMVAGRTTDSSTQYVQETILESHFPPIKSLIQQYVILWFCDLNQGCNDHAIYIPAGQSFYIPLVCFIDPNHSDTYIDKSEGSFSIDDFYSRLNEKLPVIQGDIDNDHKISIKDVIQLMTIISR